MLRRSVFALFLAVASAACGGGAAVDRTVLVDYTSEEFASTAFFNYPAKIDATPGQTIEFKQAWTGEPHTVTGGTIVSESLRKGKHWIAFFEGYDKLGSDVPNPEDPGDATVADFAAGVRSAKDKRAAADVAEAWKELRSQGVPLPDLDNPPATPFAETVTVVEQESDKAFSGVPFAFDDDDQIAQNVGQPCYKRSGTFPEDPATPCTKRQQRQPSFDGKQSVYNSGIIRYEGVRGNSFTVKLSDDIDPGTYFFYCAVHGFGQTTEVEVKREGADVASRTAVARRAREQAEETILPLEKVYRQAARTGRVTLGGEELKAPFGGLYAEGADHALVNEFVPRKIEAKVNEPITWTLLGSDHTISFDVPPYFPILQFDTPKGVRLNPRLGRPAGGAPPIPEQEGEGPPDGPRQPVEIDGGTYDGSGFWSSGLVGAEPYLRYTVRISKRGTYPYACLIHPPMIGQVVVT